MKRPDRRNAERFSAFAAKALCAAFAGAAVCGCGWVFDPLYVAVENVAVNHKTLTLTAGETATITADFGSVTDPEKYILLDDASWESGNTAVATVEAVDNATCKITAVAVGTAVVTVKVRENGKTDQCTVTVLPDNILDYITDPVFKAYALDCMVNENKGVDESGKDKNYPAWDSDGDGKLSWREAAAVECVYLWTGYDGKKVQSLAGIEYFTGLKVLRCDVNTLEKLDLSHNTAVTYLLCNYNQLAELDVTQNTALTYLYCDYNQLKELDVTQNTALTLLYCSSNQLTELDVTQNTALTYLYCDNNQLTELDVTKNTELTRLDCRTNQLAELDASNMASPDTYTLWCGNQKDGEGGGRELTLTLRAEQKALWNSHLASYGYNPNVVLAE